MNDESQKEQSPPPPGETDWFLQSLVDMSNSSGLEVGITLQVGGFLVSGMLVSGKQYFEGFASDFASAFTDQEAARGVREAFSRHGEMYKLQGEADLRHPAPVYIHLKQARFFNTSGDPIPRNRGVFWRGRLSEVSGFILGTLGTT
jgi:hypothetical protein